MLQKRKINPNSKAIIRTFGKFREKLLSVSQLLHQTIVLLGLIGILHGQSFFIHPIYFTKIF